GRRREWEGEKVKTRLNLAGMNEPLEPAKESGDNEEDEHDNIGNRVDYHANREPKPPREVDGNRDPGNRAAEGGRDLGNAAEAEVNEPDGNRGTYAPGSAPPA